MVQIFLIWVSKFQFKHFLALIPSWIQFIIIIVQSLWPLSAISARHFLINGVDVRNNFGSVTPLSGLLPLGVGIVWSRSSIEIALSPSPGLFSRRCCLDYLLEAIFMAGTKSCGLCISTSSWMESTRSAVHRLTCWSMQTYSLPWIAVSEIGAEILQLSPFASIQPDYLMGYFPVECQTWEYNISWTPTSLVSDTF